jgi:translation initiation factor IF-3
MDQFELDLVEISPNAEHNVCKIMDYKKFVYEQKKRDRSLKVEIYQVS